MVFTPLYYRSCHIPGSTPIIARIQYPRPKIQELSSPNKITGPAMVNILQPIPYTCPSASVKSGTKYHKIF